MYESLISQLEEHAREYEHGTPTGDLFQDAAKTIRRLTVLVERLSDKPTDSEIYYRKQHLWDVEYISDNLLEMFDDDQYREMVSRLKSDPVLCDKVAYRYRKYLEDLITGEDEMDCLLDAYQYMVQEETVV